MRTTAIYIISIIVTIISSTTPVTAEHLVVLATNDTHSQIEPMEPIGYEKRGGIFRRRAFLWLMLATL